MNKKGFTLIELLVVIAVIGILSTVVLVSLSGIREDARDSRRMSDLNQISLAMELYNNASGTYPITTGGANDLTSIDSYLPVVPTDPTNSGDYQYTWIANPTGGNYCVYALLEGTDSTTYHCASSEGTASTSTEPSALSSCCGLDLTD